MGITTGLTTLDQYNNTSAITGNAVDIFIYDTSKDSDGGAWRKRCQHTSWYNEASSSTRGSRKEFPAVAVIVATNTEVTIYDGDTPDLDMWMVFNKPGTGHHADGTDKIGMMGTGSCSDTNISLSSKNGLISIGSKGAGGGCTANRYGNLSVISIIDDTAFMYRTSTDWGGFKNKMKYSSGIVNRNDFSSNSKWNSYDDTVNLVSGEINDVAMTVLPNAPIDSVTGLPTPTIAVATDGGVSVIKDDGSVISKTGNNWSGTVISFSDDGGLWYETQYHDGGHATTLGYIPPDRATTQSGAILESIYTTGDANDIIFRYSTNWEANYASRPDYVYLFHDSVHSVANYTDNVFVDCGGKKAASGWTYGLTRIQRDNSVAYITSKYNTGYMTGDIRGAWNVDTDVSSLGTELVTNGNFTNNVDGWSGDSGAVVTWNSMSFATVTNGGGDNTYAIRQTSFLENGKQYYIHFRYRPNNTGTFRIRMGGTVWSSTSFTPNAWNEVDEVVTAGNDWLEIGSDGGNITSFDIDDLRIKEAVPDRSVKGNGLAVHGTPTVSAVATGAELKCISGFSDSNYLEQPYNSDLDFGTGDFSVSVWFNKTSTSTMYLFDRSPGGSYPRMACYMTGSNIAFYTYTSGTGANELNVGFSHNVWNAVTLQRVGGVMYTYLNGKLAGSQANTLNLTSTNAPLTIASRHTHQSSWTSGQIALLRFSATAPTAEQIKEIYEAEKPMFQENAKCTLTGTSDAVTALAYDDDTELLHVGTSSGRSDFQGLCRVNETTDAVGAAISASKGLIVED